MASVPSAVNGGSKRFAVVTRGDDILDGCRRDLCDWGALSEDAVVDECGHAVIDDSGRVSDDVVENAIATEDAVDTPHCGRSTATEVGESDGHEPPARVLLAFAGCSMEVAVEQMVVRTLPWTLLLWLDSAGREKGVVAVDAVVLGSSAGL